MTDERRAIRRALRREWRREYLGAMWPFISMWPVLVGLVLLSVAFQAWVLAIPIGLLEITLMLWGTVRSARVARRFRREHQAMIRRARTTEPRRRNYKMKRVSHARVTFDMTRAADAAAALDERLDFTVASISTVEELLASGGLSGSDLWRLSTYVGEVLRRNAAHTSWDRPARGRSGDEPVIAIVDHSVNTFEAVHLQLRQGKRGALLTEISELAVFANDPTWETARALGWKPRRERARDEWLRLFRERQRRRWSRDALTPAELPTAIIDVEAISGAIHDREFRIDDIRFDRSSQILVIPYFETTLRGPEITPDHQLIVEHVTEVRLDDRARIGIGMFSELEVREDWLAIESSFPVTIDVLVDSLRVRIEDRSSTHCESGLPVKASEFALYSLRFDGRHPDISNQAAQQMRRAASSAAALDTRLDFSIASVAVVEDLLTKTRSPADLWNLGAYLGEVLCRHTPGARWVGRPRSRTAWRRYVWREPVIAIGYGETSPFEQIQTQLDSAVRGRLTAYAQELSTFSQQMLRHVHGRIALLDSSIARRRRARKRRAWADEAL